MSDEGKVIEVKRYRPLWGVVRAEWNDDWDDLKKMQTIITGADNPSHIQSCIDNDVLSVRTVLSRVSAFIENQEAPPDYAFKGINFDLDSMKIPLKRSVAAIEKLLTDSPSAFSKDMEKLLLLMFELGNNVGAINNQDLIQKGMESIRKPHRGGHKNGQDKKVSGDSRSEAYRHAKSTALTHGYKATNGGLKIFLKSLNGTRFNTGVSGCAEIWLNGNDFTDSLGSYSDSSVAKIKIN